MRARTALTVGTAAAAMSILTTSALARSDLTWGPTGLTSDEARAMPDDAGQAPDWDATLPPGSSMNASGAAIQQLQQRIDSFAGRTRFEGRRRVGPPSPELIREAHDGLDLVVRSGIQPYQAVLSADATIALFLMDTERHAEIEFLGPGRIVLELEPLHSSEEPTYEEFSGDRAVDHAVARLANFFDLEGWGSARI